MLPDKLKDFLDQKAELYESVDFISRDPISIPHRFSEPLDIELTGFLVSTISWGNRKSILSSAEKMLELLEYAPADFVKNHKPSDLRNWEVLNIHRTFLGTDFQYFVQRLQDLVLQSPTDSLEFYFLRHEDEDDYFPAISRFRQKFFTQTLHRSRKHISDPVKKAACKRLHMYLRWMARSPKKGVDFGIWKKISPSYLSLPLDVHTAKVSRSLGLLKRSANDLHSVRELDTALRRLCPEDPVKYDFALFSLGAERFSS